MIKGVLIAVLVVAVLAFTGCSKEKKLLADCYAKSEAIVKDIEDFTSDKKHIDGVRKIYGVSVDGYITQEGRYRCKWLVESGEFPNSP